MDHHRGEHYAYSNLLRQMGYGDSAGHKGIVVGNENAGIGILYLSTGPKTSVSAIMTSDTQLKSMNGFGPENRLTAIFGIR